VLFVFHLINWALLFSGIPSLSIFSRQRTPDVRRLRIANIIFSDTRPAYANGVFRAAFARHRRSPDPGARPRNLEPALSHRPCAIAHRIIAGAMPALVAMNSHLQHIVFKINIALVLRDSPH
jgi:hypothetical protein